MNSIETQTQFTLDPEDKQKTAIDSPFMRVGRRNGIS